MIYAIIDIGSNTIRMAVYKVQSDNLEMLIKKKYTVGLAAYIENQCMSPAGIDKACTVLNKFKAFLHNFKIDNVSAFATAALRNIKNSETAVKEISERTGLQIKVISGEEEARFDFISVIKSMQVSEGLIVDIGGASTEIVIYKNKVIEKSVSLPIGSLNMYIKNVADIIPSQREALIINKLVLNALSDISLPKGKGLIICGIGGSFKAMWQLNCHMMTNNIDSKEVSLDNLSAILNNFLIDNISLNKALETLIDAVPERVKTVIPGMLIAQAIANYFNSSNIIYSDSGVREGYLYDMMQTK